MKTLPLMLLCAALPALSDAGERCNARSGANAPRVVELYTSEGCSSCPPADRWLSGLKGRDDVIALAFHVDYWDGLGWADRFASPAYTQRQHDVRRSAGATFVYTPQVVVDGRDWRAWPTLPPPHTGSAEIELVREGEQVRARVKPLPGAPAMLAGYWAAAEDAHVSRVQAGENTGATLQHDHVVRAYRTVSAWSSTGVRELAFTSPAVGEGGRARRTVLVVTDASTGRPVQAASLVCRQ